WPPVRPRGHRGSVPRGASRRRLASRAERTLGVVGVGRGVAVCVGEVDDRVVVIILVVVLLVLVVFVGDDARDRAADQLDLGPGRALEHDRALVLVFVDDRPEDARRRHDLGADAGAALEVLLLRSLLA